LKIIVCVKHVPDSAAQISVRDGKPDLGDAKLAINPWDEFAVEAALLQVESLGGEVIAITAGDEEAKDTLKHAIAMGCSRGILISDPVMEGLDGLGMARILAAAIRKISSEGDSVDMVMFGRQAIDTDAGMMSAQTARLLGWPSLSLVSAIRSVDLDSRSIQVERSVEEGRQIVHSKLPAAISVVKDIAEPRYPSFMGIRKAGRAEIPSWSINDLGLSDIKTSVSWLEVTLPPVREIHSQIITGDNPKEIASKLVEKIIEEGVI
jgi:electron transfer flavoprotein beta subunit